MEQSPFLPALEGLVVEAVEWLPSGADSGLVRVRGRWTEQARRESELPALGLRRAADARRFESLPDARFGRDPAVWRATYLVPEALMDPAPDELWLAWQSGARAGLPAPARGFEPPATPVPPEAPQPGGEVIGRAVLAERRAHRAESAERAQAQRAADALKAVEVLELRSAELERRLEALQSEPQPPGEPAPAALSTAETTVPASGEAAVVRPTESERSGAASPAEGSPVLPAESGGSGADSPAEGSAVGALIAAIAAVKRLRHELGEQRQRLHKSELLRAADAVALASFREAETLARGLQAELAEREHELAAALAACESQANEAAAARERLSRRELELAAIGEELAGVRAELAAVRQDAAQRAAGLEHRLVELEAALAGERRAHGIAATERETARAGLTLAESARSAESVARAALDEELDSERSSRATLIEALDAVQAELTAADAAREAAASAADSAREERASAASAAACTRAELVAAQARIAELERLLEGPLHPAGSEAGGSIARIAELERKADADLDRRAREQAAAAASVAGPGADERREFTASFDAAAAALRARVADESAPLSAPPLKAEPPPVPNRPARPPATFTPLPHPPSEPPPVRNRLARPRILTAARHPARADIVGSSKGEYPWLRGALVRLAHDDPRAATRLLLGLAPVQRAVVDTPLEYDLTIRGSGTYAISIGRHGAAARPVGRPRPRHLAAFHAAADIVTLTELLAGVEKRMGRWLGSVRLYGRRRGAEALRAALVGTGLDLAAAARAGAELDPDVVFRMFAYAIHPSWTKGHTFTVAHEITGARPMRWHVAIRNGAPVSIEPRPPAAPPDAVVAMTSTAFAYLLRGEQAPSGERPSIRGNRAAVAVLKSWTDRAQGRA